MKFTKMQGAGNDYVYVNCLDEMVANPSEVSRKVSDRHFGIGSDGLVLICPSQVADCRMRMFNADGSEGEMCGNAIRCVGKYVYDHNLIQKACISVETLGGIKQLRLMMENGRVKAAQVDMGIPIFTSKLPEAIAVDGKNYEFIGV
ncbi:MAG: diaminopimelate epimerase, partial [Hungatella sp.]